MDAQEADYYEGDEFRSRKIENFPLTESSDENLPNESEIIDYVDM